MKNSNLRSIGLESRLFLKQYPKKAERWLYPCLSKDISKLSSYRNANPYQPAFSWWASYFTEIETEKRDNIQ
jgi:hypothetical protein